MALHHLLLTGLVFDAVAISPFLPDTKNFRYLVYIEVLVVTQHQQYSLFR